MNAAVAGLGGIALVACSPAQSGIPASLTASVPATPEVTPSAEPAVSQEARRLTFEITPMGLETEAQGSVVIDISGDGYTMTITVENLDPNGQYPINLHAGACPNPATETTSIWIVQQTSADESGTLEYEKDFEGLWEIPAEGRTLTIHGRAPNDARTHIACADLTE